VRFPRATRRAPGMARSAGHGARCCQPWKETEMGSDLGVKVPWRPLMTGTPSRTARVPPARRDLKEAEGKPPNRGTRSVYEAHGRGRGSGEARVRSHPGTVVRRCVGLGAKVTRLTLGDLHSRLRAGPHRKVWLRCAEVSRGHRRLPQRPKARTTNPGPIPESR